MPLARGVLGAGNERVAVPVTRQAGCLSPSGQSTAAPGETELSTLGARIRFTSHAPAPGNAPDPYTKLARVAKRLKKTAKAPTDPTLTQGEWFIFDCEMAYGTLAVPSQRHRSAVLLFPATELEVEGARLAEGVVLLGTASHLIGQHPDTTDRPFLSTLNWLASMLESEDRDNDFWIRFPRGQNLVMASVTQTIATLKSENPILPYARISGLAKVLSIGEFRGRPGSVQLILGTPLYAEFGPWNPKW